MDPDTGTGTVTETHEGEMLRDLTGLGSHSCGVFSGWKRKKKNEEEELEETIYTHLHRCIHRVFLPPLGVREKNTGRIYREHMGMLCWMGGREMNE
ncbi:unnamed protein product [Leuciscus chuanchicus]